ncbi:MAG TPA: hypothetical protein VI953_01230 [Candidatus Paceibacterota bacterium]
MNESLRQAQGKKVLFFGIYDPNYSRNAVLMLGFRENGWEVDECRIDPKQVGGLRKYLQLWKEGKKLKGDKFNLIIVAFPGHTVVWLARLLFGKKIIFDMFVSLYNSEVEDRGNGNRMWNYLLDWYSVRLANKVLLDTNEQIKYVSNLVHVTPSKFIRVFVGSTI